MNPVLPAVPPDVVADIVDGLPSRLRKRLDDVLVVARTWPLAQVPAGVTVTVDEQTTVHVAAVVAGPDDVRCTCLLAPRCLHRAAVASLASVSVVDTADELPASEDGAPLSQPVTERERAAATALWQAGAAVLAAGIPGAGAVPQAALLRVAHEARALKLPRAASAAIRVVEQLRAAHREDPSFRLGELVGDLRELLYVSHALRRGVPLRGVARREYRTVGAERLYGLCCEPIVTASGYAGAVVHLVDRTGRFWQVATVTPGDVELARMRADTPVMVGEVRLTHRELGRAGLLAGELRASADGRISSGRGTRAVQADGVAWTEAPLDDLWRPSLRAQLNRYHAARDRPVAGHDLLFVAGTIAGAVRDGMLVRLDDGVVVTAIAPDDAAQLPYVDNLRLLAGARGAPVRLIGRTAGHGRIAVIAGGGPWYNGRIDLGLDRLQRADLPTPVDVPPAHVMSPATPPLHLLRRRVERAVEQGRAGLAGDTRDAERLRGAALPTAAGLVERLDQAGRVERDSFGRLVLPAGTALVDVWLAASVYLTAAERSIEIAAYA